jgi:hypothetical protein
MKAIDTSTLRDGGSTTENLWIYNGLDCCITLEVLDALLPQLDNLTAATYEFSRALQAPVLEMNTRGVLVDEEERWRVVAGYRQQIEFLQGQLYTILKEGLGVDINWRSSQQLKHLFYEVLGYAPIKKKGKSPSIETLWRSFNSSFSRARSSLISFCSAILRRRKASSERRLTLMEEYELRSILPERIRDDSRPLSQSSARDKSTKR